MSFRSLVLAAFGIVTLTAAVAAQQSPAPADTTTRPAAARDTAGKERTTQELRRIRVVERANRAKGYNATTSRTATRTDTPLRDVPQSATVLTAAAIADQAMQSMADVVRYVPGVTMGLGEGHRDQPTIRGNSSTADFFVDGVRDDAQYLRDLYNVERVEAVKGANAMTFGRGGGGGIFNRVSKQASWTPLTSFRLEGGSFDHQRGTLDLGAPLGSRAAARLNGMAERSDSYRDAVRIRREGINPTATILAGSSTVVRLDYERFHDDRTVDRGIPSLRGAPAPASFSTFFGDPDASHSRAVVDAAGITVERPLGGGVQLRNATRGARYDKFYQNVFAGSAVNGAGEVRLVGYNNHTWRDNLFNQTDLTATATTGAVKHTLLLGAELARQSSDNFRETAFFGDSSYLLVSAAAPMRSTGATFRQVASDADNHARLDVGAGYLQDQISFGDRWQAIAGVRFDRFALRFHDNRKGQDLSRDDRLVSPRGGLIFKPIEAASLYASYSVSHLPSSGDQFSSLTVTTQTLRPERFVNRELGAKWDVTPALALTGAVYQLDRTNSTAQDPADPTRIVQTGAQRTTGWELGASGDVTDRWQMVGGYAQQKAVLRSATTAGVAGATVPLVPHHSISLWNRVQVVPAAGVGLGLLRQSRMYAALDNQVALPAFTRVDGALFVSLPAQARLQLNVENLLNAGYYATAQGNNNILPGAPRTLRLSVSAAR